MSGPPLPPQLGPSGFSDPQSNADFEGLPLAIPNPPPIPQSPVPVPVPGMISPLQPPFGPFPHIITIRSGCWLVNYEPTGVAFVAYDGTIRIEQNANGTTASGDLYQRPVLHVPSIPPRPPRQIMLPPPNPADGIPMQSRMKYRYYLRITSIPNRIVFGRFFNLGFEMWRFNATTSTWGATPEAVLSARMSSIPTPIGFPGSYFEGDTRNSAGVITGRLKMGWISQFYRKMTVEIDTVTGSENPENNGAGETWATAFSKVGFDVNVELSNTNVTKPTPDDSYSDAEMHAAMLSRRDPVNLDSQWHYHILAVRHIESTERGIMYDWQATDSNNVPREGLGIASHWQVDDIPLWGDLRNTRWGASKPAYFRTVLHELGHAFGLEHNDIDNGYMRTSPDIAAQPGGPYPRQIKWAYADDDLRRLRHWSDMLIRPGGLQFTAGYSSNVPIPPTDLMVEIPELELIVQPLRAEVPLGAPVRVDLELRNNSDMAVNVPSPISLKSPYITGTVISSGVEPRTFRPLLHCTDDRPMELLKAHKSIQSSLTLLRGGEGPLFPVPGVSEIKITLNWPLEGGSGTRAIVIGSVTVFVTTATDTEHAKAAHIVLTNPDAHVLLVLGGDCDGLKSGKDAIQVALKDKTLRPHYVAIEAKRLATRFDKNKIVGFMGKDSELTKKESKADEKDLEDDPKPVLAPKESLKAAEQLLNHSQCYCSRDEKKKLKKLGVKYNETI
jgi:hypothetical protein